MFLRGARAIAGASVLVLGAAACGGEPAAGSGGAGGATSGSASGGGGPGTGGEATGSGGAGGMTGAGGSTTTGGGAGAGGGPECPSPPCDALATAAGCAGPFNVDQVLDLHFTMAPGDWSALKADMTNNVYFAAKFHCNSDPDLPFDVGVRRKRSGSIDKPGVKVDFNQFDMNGEWQDLKKLSLENGVSEGSDNVEMSDLLAEYLAWRAMDRSNLISGRAAFARVHVNGELLGVYTNVEQVDKRFLRSRLGDDDGWLYKHSGSADDGYKTNEMVPNPYEDALCFFDNKPCQPPPSSELETYLPKHLDIEQMLRMGAVNAIVANSDAPLGKNNNYYFYDWAGGGREYIPWDLDTVMKENDPIFGASMTPIYTDILFTHWEDDYDAILTELLEGPLNAKWMEEELMLAGSVAGPSLEADPFVAGASFADAASKLQGWWSARHAAIHQEVLSHQP